MSKPTCRELLDGIKKHEEFLNDLEWSREDDCLVYMLAARVEKVLALRVTAITDPYLDGRRSMLEQVVRLLDGEDL